LCPCCNTYELTNTGNYAETITFISCWDQDQRTAIVSLSPGETLYICSCQDPDVPACVTSSVFGSGCIQCFCYTLINDTGTPVDIQWGTCDESIGQVTLYGNDPLAICAKQGSIVSIGPITILGGSTPCSVDGDCSVITTTTTTTNYCTTTTTTTL
jgi:hypothetical protein